MPSSVFEFHSKQTESQSERKFKKKVFFYVVKLYLPTKAYLTKLFGNFLHFNW